jgi:hypothetical protein
MYNTQGLQGTMWPWQQQRRRQQQQDKGWE